MIGAVKRIVEDQVAEKRWLLNIAPVYHTPMSEGAGRVIGRRMKRLDKMLDRMMPWREEEKIEELKRKTQLEKQEEAQKAIERSEAIARKFGLG